MILYLRSFLYCQIIIYELHVCISVFQSVFSKTQGSLKIVNKSNFVEIKYSNKFQQIIEYTKNVIREFNTAVDHRLRLPMAQSSGFTQNPEGLGLPTE